MRGRVLELLREQPRSEKSGWPKGFTHREIACEVYSTDDPTPSNESAVRRAVAALVAAGLAERITEDRMGTRYDHSTGWHRRTSRYGYTYSAGNPGGVVVRRALTEDDRQAREQAVAYMFERLGH